MGKIIKDAFALLMITLVAGILLGAVRDITKDPIARQEKLTEDNSCKEVFADAEFEDVEDEAMLEEARAAMAQEGFDVQTLVKIKRAVDAGGNLLGYVLNIIDPEGYGGDISFMMGVKLDGTLNGISILAIGETAGLGMNADTDAFKGQFKDKQVEAFTYTKTGSSAYSEIDSLSGATITTNAMVNGVNAGLSAFRYLVGQEG